jgi:flagellar hook-associated protein 1 FlgK
MVGWDSMSLMSSLYIGVSGLNVSQNALNTTAHNLANTETIGYVRQQVVQVDNTYNKWGTTHLSTLQTGLGVDIATVKQVRDIFLDKSYRQEYGRQGYYQVQSEAVDEIESMFGELEGVAFQDTLSDLWTSIQELAKVPDDSATQGNVISTAEKFIERAQVISSQLGSYQTNLNTQITNKVNRINEIADGIYKLNNNIRMYESNGLEKANDLRDQRNNLLDELGGIISITYKETADGTVLVNAEGVPLVSDDKTNKMGTTTVTSSSPMLKPIWKTYGEDVFDFTKVPSASDDTDIGSLKGLLVARGSDTANYTDIPISANMTTAAYNAAVDVYNKEVDPSVIKSVQAQFDQLIHGVVTTINDILCPNKSVTLIDTTTSVVLGTVKVLDTDNAPIGSDSASTVGEELFSRKSTERYRTPTAAEIANSGGQITASSKIYVEEDPTDNYSLYTLGEVEVNPDISNDNNKLPLKDKTSGYAATVINKLKAKWQEDFATLSPNSLTMNNFNEYYTAFTGELATKGKQCYNTSQDQGTMVDSIDSQRQQSAGVSSDEELTNLIKYQHAFNASSRYINVISEMLEYVISTLGR